VTERRPQRLSPLTPVVRSFIVLLAAATTVVRDVTRGQVGATATLFVLLLVVGAAYGTASWLMTRYWVEADELRVDTGVLNRQSRRIRIDRLQGVDIVQPFVARLFGLAELRMDVAGGTREGSLAYLRLGEARRLKDLLLTRRDRITGGVSDAVDAPGAAGVSGDGAPRSPEGDESSAVSGAPDPDSPVAGPPGSAAPTSTGPASTAPASTAPARPPDRLLARVDLRTLLLSILLSGETVVLLLTAVGLGVASLVSGEYLGFSAVVPVLFGLGVALFRRFSVNYRFTVSDTSAGLQVRRGLFELSSQTIALSRVQGVVVSEPLLWRRLGWARLDVSIAGYGVGDDEAAPSTVLPVGDRRVVHELARHVLRGLDPGAVELRPVPARARWLAPVAHRFLRVGTSEWMVVSREGSFTRRTHVAPQARAQSVRITQGPLQRRLGLADVHVDSPPGPVRLRARHRDAAQARRLFDVEVAMTAWARRRP
jgi:putative membrane protein